MVETALQEISDQMRDMSKMIASLEESLKQCSEEDKLRIQSDIDNGKNELEKLVAKLQHTFLNIQKGL